MLTIWNPSEEISEILNKYCEGQFCTIHYLTTNGFMYRIIIKYLFY